MSRIGPRDPEIIGLRPAQSLSDLLWLANTRHGPGGHWFARVVRDEGDHDHLATATEAARYLADHRVQLPDAAPTAAQLADLDAIRAMVRGLLDPERGWTPEARAILDRTRFHLDEARRLVAEGSGWDAFVGGLTVPLLQLVETRDRLRICGNPHCRLMFIDVSKNRARRWCDNGGCGNRDRVRRYRSRAAPRAPRPEPGRGAEPARARTGRPSSGRRDP